jgi:hypothetical protein
MDTIREIIIKNFIARAAGITVANGYNTDIGKTVLRARKKVDPDELPVTVIWPLPEKATAEYGQQNCTMTMRVEGIASFGAINPSVLAEKILGDLKKCFLAPENLLDSPPSGWSRSPDYIDGIVYTGGGTDDYPDDDKITIGAAVEFNVTYHTNLNDPYSQ